MSRTTVPTSFVPELLPFLIMWNTLLYGTLHCQTDLENSEMDNTERANLRTGECLKSPVTSMGCRQSKRCGEPCTPRQ